MTWSKEDQRASDRRYRQRTKEQRAAKEAYRHFCYRERNVAMLSAKKAAWKKANPEKAREHARKAATTPKQRALQHKRSRLQSIAQCIDNKALENRILARADAVIPKNASPELRAELRSMLVEAVFSGRFPRRLTIEHAKEVMTDHFRMFTKYGPVSLDAPRFEDGTGSYHDTISEGLWQ